MLGSMPGHDVRGNAPHPFGVRRGQPWPFRHLDGLQGVPAGQFPGAHAECFQEFPVVRVGRPAVGQHPGPVRVPVPGARSSRSQVARRVGQLSQDVAVAGQRRAPAAEDPAAQDGQHGHQGRLVHDPGPVPGNHLLPVAVPPDDVRVAQRRRAVDEHVAALGADVDDPGAGHVASVSPAASPFL